MSNVLSGILALLGMFFTLIGVFVVWHIARPQKQPADESNRINKIRLLWFALTREDKFVEGFPWLKNDEWENVNPLPVKRETYGLATSLSVGHFVPGTPLILVENEYDRDQVVAALKYLHDSSDIDTDFVMVNTLVHLHHNPDLIMVKPKVAAG